MCRVHDFWHFYGRKCDVEGAHDGREHAHAVSEHSDGVNWVWCECEGHPG